MIRHRSLRKRVNSKSKRTSVHRKLLTVKRSAKKRKLKASLFVRELVDAFTGTHVWIRSSARMNKAKGSNLSTASSAAWVRRQYIPSVEQGIKEAMESGVLAGYPLIDIKAELYWTEATTKSTRAKWCLRSLHQWHLEQRKRNKRDPELLLKLYHGSGDRHL